mmetsp:Transcript_34711/g.53267  ORF Transcript_34711/g.53267 Transcript_34711/m.53267 type:complete len:108 (+) Transcript_34711:3564-3887(+)
MWSFGAILLELFNGVPIGMAQPCKISTVINKPKVNQGVFSIKNRDVARIGELQKKYVKSIQANLKKNDVYGLAKHEGLLDLIKQMLEVDPAERISPKEVLGHRFCQM